MAFSDKTEKTKYLSKENYRLVSGALKKEILTIVGRDTDTKSSGVLLS